MLKFLIHLLFKNKIKKIGTRHYRVKHQIKIPDINALLELAQLKINGFESEPFVNRTKGKIKLRKRTDTGYIYKTVYTLK